MSSHCPYCGQDALSTQAPDIDMLSQNCGVIIYKCRNCGICSRVSLEDELPDISSALSPDSLQNCTAKTSELELLRLVRQQIEKQLWNEALELLLTQRFPYKHPIDFIIYRNICQIAISFSSKWATPQERSLELNMLAINLASLDYYFSNVSPTMKSNTLLNLAEAFLILGDAAIQYSESHKDCYYHHCVRLLSSLADILEAETTAESTADSSKHIYIASLKAEVRLLHKCLEAAEEKPFIFFPYTEEQLKIPSSERQQISDKIEQLNTRICKADSQFNLVPPPPAPKIITSRSYRIILISYIAIAIIVILMFYKIYIRYNDLFRGILFFTEVLAIIGSLWLLSYILSCMGINISSQKRRHPSDRYYRPSCWRDY